MHSSDRHLMDNSGSLIPASSRSLKGYHFGRSHSGIISQGLTIFIDILCGLGNYCKLFSEFNGFIMHLKFTIFINLSNNSLLSNFI